MTELKAAIGQCPLPEQDYFIVINDCKDAQYILIRGPNARYIRDSQLKDQAEMVNMLYQSYEYNKKNKRLIEFQMDCS